MLVHRHVKSREIVYAFSIDLIVSSRKTFNSVLFIACMTLICTVSAKAQNIFEQVVVSNLILVNGVVVKLSISEYKFIENFNNLTSLSSSYTSNI
jgi:hypothetical protein